MLWAGKDKNTRTLHEFYQQKKYDQDYSWKDYYRPNRKKGGPGWGDAPKREWPGRSIFYRVVAVLTILALLLAVREMNFPFGEDVRLGLRYILTTDWDVRPAMEKAVKYGLQMAGVDSHLDSGMPQEGMTREAMGKSAVAGNMLIPVSGKVIRPYGWNKDALDDMDRYHPGIDIAVSPGTPVKAALSGKVKKVGSHPLYGRYVQIDHSGGVYTLYAGLGGVKVIEGQAVKAGEIIGDVARTGYLKEGGLHFELRENGSLVDPLARLELPSGKDKAGGS